MDDGAGSPIPRFTPEPWIAVLILLALAAFFALVETALASCSRTRVKAAADRGERHADNALANLDEFDSAITTLLICTNIVHISAATIVTAAVTRLWGLNAVSVSTLITTIVVFFAGEMLPKSIAKKYSYTITLGTASVLHVLMKLFAPVSGLLTRLGGRFSGDAEAEASVTEDELYDIIEDMEEEGSLDAEQSDLISSALQFGDVEVGSVITPRVDVMALDIDDSVSEILSMVKSANHSRFPVYEKSIDHIIGILQIRKFIKAYLREGESLNVRALLDEVFYTHQSAKLDELLPVMSRKKQNMAVVTDNYGGTLGIVTVEDILENLVGEIWDEDDVVQEPITDTGDGECLCDADVTVSDVFDHLGFEPDTDEEEDEEFINTLMGEWAYTQFTGIPRPGQNFRAYGLEVTVAEMDHNRILRLKARLLPQEAPEKEADEQ